MMAMTVPVHAEIRNFAFDGVVDNVDNNNFYVDESISPGTPFEGFYIFDDSTLDSNADPGAGDYQHDESTFGIVVKIGDYVFRTNPEHVDFIMEIVDGDTDHYLLRSYNNLCSRPVMVEHISWQLDGPSTALTNDFLFTSPPVLTNFPGQSFNVVGPDEAFFINGTVTSIRENPAVISERPAISLHPAVEITWPAQAGYFYHVQFSTNMTDWENIGEPIFADGPELSKFVRAAATPTFYRAEIKNFSDE